MSQPSSTSSFTSTLAHPPPSDPEKGASAQGEHDMSVPPAMTEADAPPEKGDEKMWEVAWDEGDPLNPLNSILARKWIAVLIISSGSICVTCTSSMASSTYAQIEQEFHVGREVAILSVSLFVAGLGCGPLLLGPLSEFIGRKLVYVLSFLVFFLFNFPVAFANNIAVHLIFRFLTGFAGSAFLSVAGGSVSDLFLNTEVGPPMAFYTVSPFLGPVLGPLIAGFINQNTSWRWTYYAVIIWSLINLLLIVLLVPETYSPILLKKKAKRLRQGTGDHRYYAPIEKRHLSFARTILRSCTMPFQILAYEPMALLLDVWTALLLGILYLFFVAYPIVFRNVHGFNQQSVGLAFLGIGLGEVIGAATNTLWGRLYAKHAAQSPEGKAPPEARLPVGMAGAVLVPMGLLIFTFTSYRHVHWIAPIIGSIPFGTGVVYVFTAVFTFLVDAYRPYAASAMAGNSFVRSSFAAGFPLFATAMYDRLGVVGASGLLTGLTALMIPLPFVFYRLGPQLRKRSRFAPSQ